MLSIVIPVFQAEHSIRKLVREIKSIFPKKNRNNLVNDCSPDNSHIECLKTYDEFSDLITYIKLAKICKSIMQLWLV